MPKPNRTPRNSDQSKKRVPSAFMQFRSCAISEGLFPGSAANSRVSIAWNNMSAYEKAPYYEMENAARAEAGLPPNPVCTKYTHEGGAPSRNMVTEGRRSYPESSRRSRKATTGESPPKSTPSVAPQVLRPEGLSWENHSAGAIDDFDPTGIYLVQFFWNSKNITQSKSVPGLIIPTNILLYRNGSGTVPVFVHRTSLSVIKSLKMDSSYQPFSIRHEKIEQCRHMKASSDEDWWIKILQVLGFYTKDEAKTKVQQMKGLKNGTQSGDVFLYKPPSNL